MRKIKEAALEIRDHYRAEALMIVMMALLVPVIHVGWATVMYNADSAPLVGFDLYVFFNSFTVAIPPWQDLVGFALLGSVGLLVVTLTAIKIHDKWGWDGSDHSFKSEFAEIISFTTLLCGYVSVIIFSIGFAPTTGPWSLEIFKYSLVCTAVMVSIIGVAVVVKHLVCWAVPCGHYSR